MSTFLTVAIAACLMAAFILWSLAFPGVPFALLLLCGVGWLCLRAARRIVRGPRKR